MKQFFAFMTCLAIGTASFSRADTEEDAAYIVRQHMVLGDYEEKLELLSQSILAKVEPAFERLGAEIIAPDRLWDEIGGTYFQDLEQIIQENAIIAFQEVLAPEELALLANYYRSDEGQAFLVQSFTKEQLDTSAAFFQVGPGKPLLTRMPELLAVVNEPLLDALLPINELFSTDRMADIMEMKRVVHFEDECRRQSVVDALREAG